MKDIIIILTIFCSLNAIGQIKLDSTHWIAFTMDSTGFYHETPDSIDIRINGEIIGRVKNNFQAWEYTTALIMIYADECFKDSTLVTWYGPSYTYIDSISGIGHSTADRRMFQKWEHKQPTFIGFIEWVKTLDK